MPFKGGGCMESVVFCPWVGENYRKPQNCFGIRILILGESHYGNEDDKDAQFTSDVVQRFTQKGERHRFFTILAKVLLSKNRQVELNATELSAVWNSIAFYNYIQDLLPDPRILPKEKMWTEARKPFFNVLEALEPDLLIVAGSRLKANIPEVPSHIELCAITHPSSSRFDYDNVNPLVCISLQLARAKKNNPTH
jgi:hypothetical protein